MGTAQIPRAGWRLPGCGEACRLVLAIRPGLLGRAEIETHDPASHEAWGRSHCGLPHGKPTVVETGPLRVDLGRVEVTVDGTAIYMTPVEMRLMLALARMAGRLASVRTLIDAAWGPAYLLEETQVNAHLVRVNIARLRARLGRAGDLITTRPGLGYRLETIAPGAAPPTRLPLTHGGKPKLVGWSLDFERCVCCGTTEYRHNSHGRCSRCNSGGTRRRIHVGPCAAPPPHEEDT